MKKPHFAIGLGALVLILTLACQLSLPPSVEGDLLSFKDEALKLKAAQALNATVRLKDFKAEVIKVAKGDNFWGIARRQKTSIDTVFALNPELEGLGARVGRPLLVANMRGAMHRVEKGEDAKVLAELYKVKVEEILEANKRGWFGFREGQLLFLPGAKPKKLSKGLADVFEKRRALRSPLAGRLSSTMGSRSDPFTGASTHHNGIDIKADYNEAVGAAASGKVVMAGWNGGYGKCVKIDHGNGYVTVYGHLNSILVRQGQEVKQHQLIGKVGSTGRATGPHLHFTVYYQGKLKNPLDYLW